MDTDELKQALRAETQAWRLCYARHCNAKYRDLMMDTFRFIDDMSRRLDRPINDLNDVRIVADALHEIRLKETDVDMSIAPIEVRLSQMILRSFFLRQITRETHDPI